LYEVLARHVSQSRVQDNRINTLVFEKRQRGFSAGAVRIWMSSPPIVDFKSSRNAFSPTSSSFFMLDPWNDELPQKPRQLKRPGFLQ